MREDKAKLACKINRLRKNWANSLLCECGLLTALGGMGSMPTTPAVLA